MLGAMETDELSSEFQKATMYKSMKDDDFLKRQDDHRRSEESILTNSNKLENITLIEEEKPVKAFKANRYAANKTACLQALNIALITSNGAQLKNTLDEGNVRPYYIFFLVALSTSLALQVALGFLLLWVGSRENKLLTAQNKGTKKTDKLNNCAMFLVVTISLLNIIMNAFAVAGR